LRSAYRFTLIMNLIFLCFLSCSSSERPSSRRHLVSSSPEIGKATMSGGETVNIRGYTSDSEVNRQIKLIDLEIIDCYKQNVGKIGVKEMLLDFSFYIDRNGRSADIRYKSDPKDAAYLGECIKNDIKSLSFRPGSPRDISSYRMVFTPITRNEAYGDENITKTPDDPREKMIRSLADMKKFRDCYEKELKRTPGIGGKFTLRFMISVFGEVENVEIINNTFSEPEVPLCVVKKLVDTPFPHGDTDDIVEVNFTFTSSAPLKRRRTMDIDM